jgi:exodeoxyribonuclease III
MKIATFNINNINRRLPNLLNWLKAAKPDVVCLQELKCEQAAFPAEALVKAGYSPVWKGQRTWNGVAILSRETEPLVTRTALPGDKTDSQSRYIEAAIGGLIVGCIYLPNGNPQPGPKFDYKLAWFKRLQAHSRKLLKSGAPVILAGDFNVAPTDLDIYPTTSWDDDARSRRAERPMPSSWPKAGPMPCAKCIPASASTRFGIIGETAGSATQAFASTTCCSAGHLRSGYTMLVSTAGFAANRTQAITRQLGLL